MVSNFDNSNMQASYDAIAPLYEEYSSQKKKYLDAVEIFIIEKLKPEMRLLDVGSGDGRRLKNVLEATGIRDAVSVEPSREMAKICREKTGFQVYEVFGEQLGDIDIGKFDVITAMWNVFGHIPTSKSRLQTLINLRDKLNPQGFLMFDVNNRHNAKSYGHWNVLKRRIIDFFHFDEKRGNAEYDWRIGEKTFRSMGHLFIPKEVDSLARMAGFKIKECFTVDYSTGEKSSSKFKGQLFYCLEKGID